MSCCGGNCANYHNLQQFHLYKVIYNDKKAVDDLEQIVPVKVEIIDQEKVEQEILKFLGDVSIKNIKQICIENSY